MVTYNTSPFSHKAQVVRAREPFVEGLAVVMWPTARLPSRTNPSCACKGATRRRVSCGDVAYRTSVISHARIQVVRAREPLVEGLAVVMWHTGLLSSVTHEFKLCVQGSHS